MTARKGFVPRALRKGDTVAFISPSSRYNSVMPLAIDRSKAWLEHEGFKVKIIFTEITTTNFREATLQRVAEVHDAFRDQDVKAILCTSGGDHANELLPHLDFELIASNPKIFVCYSDITYLHHAIFAKTDLHTFYGPSPLSEFGDFPSPLKFTADNFLATLCGSAGEPLGPLPRSMESPWDLSPHIIDAPSSLEPRRDLISSPPWTWIRPGKATGRIFGGVFNCVAPLPGTPFWPDYNGRILMLESSFGATIADPQPIQRIRSLLADLTLTGVFQKISGLVIGRGYKWDEGMREEVAKVVREQLEGTEFPVLMNVDFGHSSPILTIPLNALVELDSERDLFAVLEPAVLEEYLEMSIL